LLLQAQKMEAMEGGEAFGLSMTGKIDVPADTFSCI
jgi:hypothetical protein